MIKNVIKRLIMPCTEEQYGRDFGETLNKLGYRQLSPAGRGYIKIAQTSWWFLCEAAVDQNDPDYIDHYNPELFLALAAMTEGEDFIAGEWGVYTNNSQSSFTKGKLYKFHRHSSELYAIIDDRSQASGYSSNNKSFFRKPTKEELIAHFSKSTSKQESTCKYGGQIANFPVEVVEKMLERQVEQGNSRDVSVFEGKGFADKFNKGFDWHVTPEGGSFWRHVIQLKNFKLFFDKYPKDDFVLPEGWCIKLTEENTRAVHEWKKNELQRIAGIPIGCYVCCTGAWSSKKNDWEEITFEQFKEHVLKKSDKDENYTLPEKWVIKVDPSVREFLAKFDNLISGSPKYKSKGYKYTNGGYYGSHCGGNTGYNPKQGELITLDQLKKGLSNINKYKNIIENGNEEKQQIDEALDRDSRAERRETIKTRTISSRNKCERGLVEMPNRSARTRTSGSKVRAKIGDSFSKIRL